MLNEEASLEGTVPQTQSEDVTDPSKRKVDDRLSKSQSAQNNHFREEGKAVVKQLVAGKLTKLVQGTLKDILCTFYQNSQSSIHSVVYIVVEQVMLNLLRKDAISETLVGHNTKFVNAEAATDRLSDKLLTWSSFLAPIATFERCKTD